MGNLLAYSGIATKVKAMESHLITPEQYRNLAALDSVTEALDYLKQFPAYKEIFSGTDSSTMHRGDIEQLLTLSQYQDFAKLYRFSSLKQRKFLDLYFIHYEIAILKRCLRKSMGHELFQYDFSVFQEFFERHTSLNLAKLSTSKNLTEFTSNLSGTPYYNLVNRLNNQDNLSSFDYETSLDLFYFREIWKTAEKHLKKSERSTVKQCFGTKLDMLNLQWIYRAKHFYHMEPADIYSILIPIQFKLKKEDINRLAESASEEDFFRVLDSTYYGKISAADLSEKPDLERLSAAMLNRIYQITRQKEPYSIAALNSYLYFKEQEQYNIITIIESIRYGVPSGSILASIDNLS